VYIRGKALNLKKILFKYFRLGYIDNIY